MFGCIGLDCFEGLGLGPNELPSDWDKHDLQTAVKYTDADRKRFHKLWLKQQGVFGTTKADPKTGQTLYPIVKFSSKTGPYVDWWEYPPGTIDPGHGGPKMTPESNGATIPATSLDFSIDKKAKQESPKSWDPYKPTAPESAPTAPESAPTPSEAPERPPAGVGRTCGTICTTAVGRNSCVNTCTGERWTTDAKDRKITPSPASPTVTPSVKPAISPAFKARTMGRAAMSGLGCVGLGCMGALTADQKTKAASMQNALNDRLAHLRAYKTTVAAADVEDAERILTNGVDKFWSDINNYNDWDAALNTYRGLTKIAEDAIKVAQNKVPYSTQNLVANKVGAQALAGSVAVAQQSSATQASLTPFMQGALNTTMSTFFPTPEALQAGPDVLTKIGDMIAARRASEKAAEQAAQKSNKTLYVVGGAVVGLALLYFAFRAKD